MTANNSRTLNGQPSRQERIQWQALLMSPRIFFLVAAFFSFLLSVALFFTGDRERGIFVGIWVPSILSAGNLILGRSDR